MEDIVWQRRKKNVYVRVSHLSDDNTLVYYHRISGRRGVGRMMFKEKNDFLQKYKPVEYRLN